MEDFESRLTRELHELVDGEHPSPELRGRITEELGVARPPARRRWLPAVAAALLVIAGIGALVNVRGGEDGDGSVDLATAPDEDVETTTTTADEGDRRSERSTTTATSTTDTTAAPTTDGADEAATTSVEHPEDPDGRAPSTTVPATNPPSTSPPTTALVCERSTNPACGPFRWEPQPTNQGASLTIEAPDVIFVDEPTQLTLSMSDPDGPVTFDCYAVNLDRPGTSTGACSTVRQECPQRFGPWSPPAPEPGRSSTETSVTFQETGTYVISVDVDPPAGCDNVDPYRSGATATLIVEVVEPKI